LRNAVFTTLAAAVGLAATGLAAAGLLGSIPDGARVLVVCVGVILAPAAVSAAIVSRRMTLPAVALAYPLAVLGVLSVHAVAAEAAARAGLRLSSYTNGTTWVLLGGYLAVMVASLRARSSEARVSLRRWLRAAVVVAALGAIACAARPALAPSEDSLDHIGYVRRALTGDSLRPDGILAWPETARAALPPDPRKGSLHALLAAITALAGVDPAVTWVWFPAVMFPVAALAFVAFAASFVTGAGSLAACVALFALSYGGTALQFAPTTAYGQNLAVAWYWVIAALSLRAAERGFGSGRGAALALLAAGGVFVHLGVAVHVFVLAATLALLGGMARLPRAGRARAAALLVVASGAAALERLAVGGGAANPIHTHVQGMMGVGEDAWVASPMEVLREHGLVFLGGLVLVGLLVPAGRRDPGARRALSFCVLPLALAFLPWLATPIVARASYMVLRVLLNAPAIPAAVLAIAWAVRAAREGGAARRVVTCAAIALWAVVFVSPAVDAFIGDARRLARPRHPVAGACPAGLVEWARGIPPGSTILSDPATSYGLSAFTSHRFVALYEQHANPYDAYALDRLRAVRDVLSPYVVGDAALAACRGYRVDYVVVNRSAPAGFLSPWSATLFPASQRRLESMSASFQRVLADTGVVAFRFQPGATVQHAAWGPAPPVAVDGTVLPACDVPVPDDEFRLTGLSVSPARVLPGDSVVFTLGYRRDRATAFGFPFVVHLRLDHSSVPAQARYPGEKYVRRARERWSGEFVRARWDARPGGGVFDVDLWPMGAELRERFYFVVPRALRPGTYRVEAKVERASLLPNFHLDDLLFNRDHYSGVPCATLVVGDARTRPEGPR
jgi:hypothetical protein